MASLRPATRVIPIDQQGHTEALAFSRTALDYGEIQTRLPKPPGRPQQALRIQR